MTSRLPTLRVQTILTVLDHAKKHGLALPAAVDAIRKELRADARRARKRAMELRLRPAMAKFYTRSADRMCRNSQRIRRLQLEFASWRTSAYQPVPSRSARKRIAV